MEPRFITQSWPFVSDFYRKLIQASGWRLEPMLDLVEYIASSPYATALFGSTAHDELHIGRVPNFVRGDNDLSIRFDPATKHFTFTFRQGENDLHPWSVTSTEAQGLQTFKHLLHKRLRWFQES